MHARKQPLLLCVLCDLPSPFDYRHPLHSPHPPWQDQRDMATCTQINRPSPLLSGLSSHLTQNSWTVENSVHLHGSRLQMYTKCALLMFVLSLFPRKQFQNQVFFPYFTRFTARGCSFLTKFSFIKKTIKNVKGQREILLESKNAGLAIGRLS